MAEMDPELTNIQRQQLHEALISAFPTRYEMARLVSFKLDVDLEVVAGGDTYANVVFNLVKWAVAQGKVEALVTGAREQNPGNQKLRDFATEIGIQIPRSDEPEQNRKIAQRPRVLEKLPVWLRTRAAWIVAGLFLIVVALVTVIQMNSLFICLQTKTIDELKAAGAYVKIERIDISSGKRYFIEGDKEKVVAFVSYYLPGQSVDPSLEFRYLFEIEQRPSWKVMQNLDAKCGKHRIQMEGDVIPPTPSNLHDAPFQIVVDLNVPDEVTGGFYTVASDSRGFQLLQAQQASLATTRAPLPASAGEVITITQPITITLVRVPSGPFWMGSDTVEGSTVDYDYGGPKKYVVYLAEYYIGKHEVTNAQY